QIVNVSMALIPVTLYVIAEQTIAIFDPGSAWYVWVFTFIAYDLCYYWNHRVGHEVNVFWASHVVHHSSEEYNLTTALRQTGTGMLSAIFYLPLALLGIDPLIVITVGALNLTYQFWVHTRHIGKLGWFEWFFVTPSNHRAHHAQNSIYIDKNYGGVFILWDRLFGTFQEELDSEPVIFGITGAVKSWNPLWINAQVYAQLWHDAWHTDNWWHKLTVWFRRTGWRPPDVAKRFPLDKVDLTKFEKYDVPLPGSLKLYSLLQYFLLTAVILYFTTRVPDLSKLDLLIFVLFSVVGFLGIGAVMEGKHYAGMFEWLRNGLVIVVLPLLPKAMVILCVSLTVFSLPLLFYGRSQHDKMLGSAAGAT
ncbi:MAG: sterol desaturase family protein, partial [Acidiferrobacterales bacterium]|nr:sterol desaturase family protein [Acidiferrobacterales bacterium]